MQYAHWTSSSKEKCKGEERLCEPAIKIKKKLPQLSWILAPGIFTNFLVLKLFIRLRALLPFL